MMKRTQNPYHYVIPLFMADQADRLIGPAIMCRNCRKAHPVSTEQDALFRNDSVIDSLQLLEIIEIQKENSTKECATASN